MPAAPANVDIAAPTLSIGDVVIDKFMGMTAFMIENPSGLLEVFEGQVVGIETNSETNKVSFQIAVHSESVHMAFIEKCIKLGAWLPLVVEVPTTKQGMYHAGQVIHRSCERALIKGGGTSLGGKNAGMISFNCEGMNPKVLRKQGDIDPDSPILATPDPQGDIN